MTTQKTEATASDPPQEDPAKAEDQVAQAVTDVEEEGAPAPETTPEITPEPEKPSFATVSDINTAIGGLQSRIAQRAGQDNKTLNERLDGLEKLLTQAADNSYTERLRTMEPEARETFLLEENKRLRTPQEPAPVPEQQVQANPWGLTAAEQASLTERVTGMIEGMDVEGLNAQSREVWKGATGNESLDQLVTLARTNLRATKTPAPKPTPAAAVNVQTTEDVPVTTQGAPTSPNGVYDTLTDASTALSKGEMTTADFRQWMRDRNIGQG